MDLFKVCGISAFHVRMMLLCELPIRRYHFLLGGVFFYL
jgi:hypothetical protein